jgi:hypothetical protein
MQDKISKQTIKTKKVYKPKMWTCEFCKYTGTIKNKTNHLRTNKHKNNEKKELDI